MCSSVRPHQGSCGIQHGLVRQEVFLGRVVTAVGQLVVLDQEAQVSHLPDLQLRGFWGVPDETLNRHVFSLHGGEVKA